MIFPAQSAGLALSLIHILLVLICVITVSKFICGISEFPIDVSLPFFVCAAILICYLTLYRSPRELVDKTLSIVVTEMNNAVILSLIHI